MSRVVRTTIYPHHTFARSRRYRVQAYRWRPPARARRLDRSAWVAWVWLSTGTVLLVALLLRLLHVALSRGGQP